MNTDGNDYIPQNSTPIFISDIQKSQLNYVAPSTIQRESISELTPYNQACNLSSDYSALLFDVRN